MLFPDVEPDAVKVSAVDLTFKNATVCRLASVLGPDAAGLEELETEVACFSLS